MYHAIALNLRFVLIMVLCGNITLSTSLANAQEQRVSIHDTATSFTINAQVGLYALLSLSDAHLKKVADAFAVLAGTNEARSGVWERIRTPLAQVAQMNVPAVYWFARPDGNYWTLGGGLASAKLTDRAYFTRLMAGQTVLGDLVVSHSANRNTAIVAVPVRAPNHKVIGALGCSVHLDSMTALIKEQLGGLESRLLFFAIDAKPLGALNSDATLIFTDPMKLGEEDMQQAFRTMLAGEQGVVSYNFHGGHRTVLYKKSPITNWWYGFGMMDK